MFVTFKRANGDTISAIFRDIEPGKGELTIQANGASWVGYWNAMGDRNVRKFIEGAGPDYLANCLVWGPRQIRKVYDKEVLLVKSLALDLIRRLRSDGVSKIEIELDTKGEAGG